MNPYSVALNCLTVLSLIGCASANTYRSIEAARVPNGNDANAPSGIVEDAMRIEPFHLFADGVYKRIETVIRSAGSDRAKAAQQVRTVLCNGKTPKVKGPQLTVHLVLPKPSAGEPMDKVAKQQSEFIKLTRIYLKRWWLDEASDVDLIGQQFNKDFTSYKENIFDTNGVRKQSRRVSALVPITTRHTVKDIEKFYSEIRATPSLPPMHLPPDEWHPSRHFLSIDFPKERRTVLTYKISDFLVGAWGHERYGTESTSAVLKNLQLTPTTEITYVGNDESHNARNTSHYAISINAWKLKDGSVVRPLQISFMNDLAYLKREFAWSIPASELEHLFGEEQAEAKQYFGIDEKGNFSPALTLEHNSYIWTQLLFSQTEVTETAQADGSIMFTVQPMLDAFCKWAVPVLSLESN